MDCGELGFHGQLLEDIMSICRTKIGIVIRISLVAIENKPALVQ